MKKIFAIIVIALQFILCGCSKDDEQPYTEKQQKALSVFNGTFADYQYSNLSNELLGDPDIIEFGVQYNEPIELRVEDFMDGYKYMGEAHGECVYKKKPLDEYESVDCFYKVSYDANALTLYRKSNKEIYRNYSLFIESQNGFRLYETGLSLPYIFKKQ